MGWSVCLCVTFRFVLGCTGGLVCCVWCLILEKLRMANSKHLTLLKHEHTKTTLYKLYKDNWIPSLFIVFDRVSWSPSIQGLGIVEQLYTIKSRCQWVPQKRVDWNWRESDQCTARGKHLCLSLSLVVTVIWALGKPNKEFLTKYKLIFY